MNAIFIASRETSKLRYLILFYFFLLIFEGTLRKWLLPQLSSPLLLIRDPVVIWIYITAFTQNLFPRDRFTMSFLGLSYLFLLVGLLEATMASGHPLSVVLYGWRTNFLHLPLLFLIPKVFKLEDVKELGRWVLMLMIPMSVLMIYQFASPVGHFINRIAGEGDGLQITSVMGKVRPAGTFSFTTGAVQYLSLAASFILYGLIQKNIYSNKLIILASISLLAAVAVSGSRSALASVGTIVIMGIIALLLNPVLLRQSYRFVALGLVIAVSLGLLPFVQEGIEVMTTRLVLANAAEEGAGGTGGRFLGSFLEPFLQIDRLPFWGYGLGMGTNAGSGLLTGKVEFLLAEGEWGRVIFESGAILGSFYLGLRVVLAIWLFLQSLAWAGKGEILALLLCGNCVLGVINGQLGQATTLGFIVFCAGLCLAAAQDLTREGNHENSLG